LKLSPIPPAHRAQNPTAPLTDLQALLVAGLGQSDFQPPSAGAWTIPRPPSAVDEGLQDQGDQVEALDGLATTEPPPERPDRLQLTTYRPNVDIASLVATLQGQDASEQEEEEDEGVRLRENQLQALLRQLDSSEFREPAKAWDIATEAKKFRDQLKKDKVSFLLKKKKTFTKRILKKIDTKVGA
jgi:hypothetical protein